MRAFLFSADVIDEQRVELAFAIQSDRGAFGHGRAQQPVAFRRSVDRDASGWDSGPQRGLELVAPEHVAAQTFLVEQPANCDHIVGLERRQELHRSVRPAPPKGLTQRAGVRT